MSHQNGYVFRRGKSWYGRWRRDELDANSQVVRRQHCEKLCDHGDRYRCKRDVLPLLADKLKPLNEQRVTAESTLTIAEYVEQFYFPDAERELKPSTVHGYRGLWRMYLKLPLGHLTLRDFQCHHATTVLAAIHRDHGLSRKSLRHNKALLRTIFTHAKRAGVIGGEENPVKDAGVPRAAKAGKPTYAYSADEIFQMLEVLEGVARAAVALMYFCGLRPGGARASRWEDYDGKMLRVRMSMWRKHLTEPKTSESVAPVPVAETLADILAESRQESGYILAGPSGKPAHLDNLASRTVRPTLALCAECRKTKTEHGVKGHEFKPLPEWHGWYALRRGTATLATSLDTPLAAKSLLRHSSVQTTATHCIKSIPADALRAVGKIDALFQKNSANTIPN
jgi:integrase